MVIGVGVGQHIADRIVFARPLRDAGALVAGRAMLVVVAVCVRDAATVAVRDQIVLVVVGEGLRLA